MEHTPTPWIADKDYFGKTAKIWTAAKNGKSIEGYCLAELPAVTDGLKIERTIANAEFIVTAVNAHEELVKALQNALNQLETNRVFYRVENNSNERTNMTSAAILEGKQALAKAGIKQ